MTTLKNVNAFRAALFSLSASLLALEISLMRVLKIEGFGNFTSTAIALALLGFGLSGTLAGLSGRKSPGRAFSGKKNLRNRFPSKGPEDLDRAFLDRVSLDRVSLDRVSLHRALLIYLPALFALTLGIAFSLSEAVDFDPLRILWDGSQFLRLLLRFSLYTLPFTSGALFVLLAFRIERAGRAYFYNLAGSAFGIFALILSLYVLPPERVFLVPLLFALCALMLVFFAVPVGWRRAVYASLAACTGLILALRGDITILPYKARQLALNLPDARILSRKITPFGTLELIGSEHLRYSPGLSLAFQGKLPGQLGLYLDGDRLAAIDRAGPLAARAQEGGGSKEDSTAENDRGISTSQTPLPEYLSWQIQFAPYTLHTSPRTLIIGLGGGVGVERALAGGSREITVVEENPSLPSLLFDSLKRYTGATLDLASYRVVTGSTRRYLKSTPFKWDIIELSLPDSGASSIGGIYSTFSNYSLTVQAFGDYLSHLTDGGVLAVTISLDNPPRGIPKLIALARGALADSGAGPARSSGPSGGAAPGAAPAEEREPYRHVFALRSWSTGTLLVKQSPFQAGEIERLKAFCSGKYFDLIYYPGIRKEESNLYTILEEDLYYVSARALLENGRSFVDSYVFDIRPSTDERPYFFSFIKLSAMPFLFREAGKKWLLVVEGGSIVLFATLIAVSLLSSLLIGAPFLFLGKRMQGKGLKTFAYFSLIAIGYMFMEIMLMERLTRSLAHPMLSNSAVLAALLIFSGIGSYCSDLFQLKGKSSVYIAVGFLTAYGTCMLTTAEAMISSLARASLPFSAFLTVLLLAPLAFAMGIPFPAAVRQIKDRDAFPLTWAWSVNGYFSVIASVGAPLLSLSTGLASLGILALACYILAAILFPE